MQATISVAVMLCVSAASDAAVSVRDCTSCFNERDYWKSRVNQPEKSAVFTFGYQQGDIFSTRIYLKNKAVNVFSEVYIKHVTGEYIIFKKKLQKSNKESFYRIRSVLSNAKFAIEVQLFSRTGLCPLEQIVKGIDLSQPSEESKRTKYNEVCLRSHWCEIVVDLENRCGGLSAVHETNEPMSTTRTATHINTFNRSIIIPYVPSPTHAEVPTSPHEDMETITVKSPASDPSLSAVHETNEPMSTTRTATHINTFNRSTIIRYVPSPTHAEVPTSPHEDMETTTIKSTASDPNAQTYTSTTNYVIMVNSSIAAAAVVLLVIVAIRTRCWVKPKDTHAQGTSQLSTTENDYKLRQNLPSLRDPEYSEIIDPEYEIIDPEYEVIDTDEHLYEEIIL